MLAEKKISIKKIAHYINFSLAIVAIFTAYFVLMFLYNNFYEAITQSDVIIVLKRDVASEMVDMKKFDEIIEKLEKKSAIHEVKAINNPF